MRRVRVVLILTMVLAALPASLALAQYPQPTGVCSAAPSTLTVTPNTTIDYIVTALTTGGQPAPQVQGTATLVGQPGAGAKVVTPTFITDAHGHATVQVFTGDTPGDLQIQLTCGALSSSSVLRVSASGQ